MNVWVRTMGAADDTMLTADTRDGIWVFQWAWNGRHLLYLQDRNGDENLHLWSAEIGTGIVRDSTLRRRPGAEPDDECGGQTRARGDQTRRPRGA